MDRLSLPAQIESLVAISSFVLTAATQAGLDDYAAWQVQLAVDEAATNIIQYAYDLEQNGQIVVEQSTDAEWFTIRLRDSGRGFDPHDVPPPDLQSPLEQRQVGGLGLYLMHRLMDKVRFDTDSAGNVVTLAKRRPAGPSAPLIYRPQGRLDASTAPLLLHQLLDQARTSGWRVVLDMRDATFISSTGLRNLLLLMKELRHQGGDLRICAMQERVAAVFEMTGFDQVFTIEPTLADALRAFGIAAS